MACSVFFMLAFFISSCKQDLSVQPTPSVEQVQNDKIVDLNISGMELKDDVLYFKDAQSFRNAEEVIFKNNTASYEAYCKKIGFKSQAILFNEAVKAIDNLKTMAEFESFKSANSDIFTFEKGYIDLKMESQLMPQFVGKSGMMYIGADAYFYDNLGYIFIKGGDNDKLIRTKISRQSSVNEGIMVGKNVIQVQTRAACAVEQNTGWVGGASKRRGILSAHVEASAPFLTGTSGSAFAVEFLAVHKGRAQKHSIFGWNDYSTNHGLDINSVSQGLSISNNNVQLITSPLTISGSASNTNIIQFVSFICRWDNVDFATALEAPNQRLPFISINDTYTNQGSVNTSINCQ